MSELMGLEMTFGNELLATLATIEGSLTSVCSHVSFQIASLWELLKAFLKRTDQNLLLIFGPLHLLDLGYTGD